MNTIVAVYDTKPYDRESLTRIAGAEAVDWRFLDCRLGPDTASAAGGAQAVCVFVNDDVGRDVLRKLRDAHVGLVALRCTGFNRVDLSAQGLEDDVLARLLTFPNVVVTAHQAFLTREALRDIATVTVENIRRFAAGQPLLERTQL